MALPSSGTQFAIPYFSNPTVKHAQTGRSTGTATADNARSLRSSMPLVAQFRATIVPKEDGRILTGHPAPGGTQTGGDVSSALDASYGAMFALAAELYPELFKNGSAWGSYDGYAYKYFADSKIYIGIKDSKVYTLGGIYGSTIKELGSVSAVSDALQTSKAKATP
jgi:hypothetical protein